MKLAKVYLKNFRCFEDYEVLFGERTTVLIGKNGTGKTNLITALKKSLSFIFSRKNVGVQNSISLSGDLHLAKFDMFDARFDNSNRDFIYPIAIAMEAIIDGVDMSWELAKGRAGGSILESGYKDALKTFLAKHSDTHSALPVLAFFSDSYPHIKTNISKNTIAVINKVGAMPKSFGYYQWDADTNCAEIWQQRYIKVYNDLNDYKKSPSSIQDEINLLQELLNNNQGQLHENAAEVANKIKQLEIEKSKLSSSLPINSDAEEIAFIDHYLKTFTEPLRNDLPFINAEFQVKNILVSRPKGGDHNIQFVFANGNTTFFDNLPQGYKRLFSIIFDIAYRCYVLNKATEPQGIVFIDEIELHLHPSLQQEVLARFRKTFPNVQFFVSTHTPLVISNMKADGKSNKIIKLEHNGLGYTNTPVGNIYGLDYNTGLTDIMDAQYRPAAIDNLIDSYVILKLRNKENEAKIIWDEIFEIVGHDNERMKQEINNKLEANR